MSKNNEIELSFSDPKLWYKRTLPINSKEWKDLRQIIIKRDNNTCNFCGIRLLKYLIVDHIDGDATNNNLTNLRLNCKACDSVRHCGLAGIHETLTLGMSNMSQTEIVEKSHEFYLKNGRNPLPKEIASDYIEIDNKILDCFTIATLRLKNEQYKEKFKYFKGFFTKKMNFSYLKFAIRD